MIKVEIDGKQLSAENGEMLIEVADRAGIPIPRFCYHKKLSIAANCRMCLVEVEKAPKPLPACATPVADGMKVQTCSDIARGAQQSVMEFLLINHPLDCPICDQGGECELQDVSLGYGEDISRYTQGKRAVKDHNIGPLIATDMTRCIHCTRCVRFGDEVAGLPELGVTGRGENTEISTYIEHSLSSEVSGNVIDLCPVGALTSKPYRFTARAWELNQQANISPHDCLGSNIYVHQRRDEVMRVVPKECETINETWIADRDRYSYLGVKSYDRITEPRIKQNGKWQTVDWLTALKTAVTGLGQVLDRQGPEQVGGIIHPNSTLEECYLFQKWLRALNVNNIDHRCQATQSGVSSVAKPRFDCALAALENQDALLLVGSNLRKEQPLAGLRVRKAQRNGATVSVLNNLDYDFHFTVSNKVVVSPREMLGQLAAIAKAAQASLPADIEVAPVTEVHQRIAEQLLKADNSCILLGPQALNHPQASVLRAITQVIADKTGAKINEFPEGGNVMGAHLSGVLPDRSVGGKIVGHPGYSAADMFTKGLAAYVLMNLEADLDFAYANQALSALDNARFVVQISPFVSSAMETYADVILPMAAFTETSGTLVNIENQWQSFQAATNAQGQARPGWKILRVLANLCHCEGFDYTASSDIRDECQLAITAASPPSPSEGTQKRDFAWPDKPADAYWRITALAPYRVDNVVRRSLALQEVNGIEQAAIYLPLTLAATLKLTDGDWVEVEQEQCNVRMLVKVDARLPEDCVYTPAGFTQTNLGAAYGFVSIRTIKK